MPDKAVLDSCAVAAMFFPEGDVSDRVWKIIAEIDPITLDFAVIEVGNIAWKRAVLFDEDADMVTAAFKDAREFMTEVCRLVSSLGLTEKAFEIATADKVSFYDALFLALAEVEGATLLTLDRKLYEKTRSKRDVRMA